MIRWINSYIGTAAWSNVADREDIVVLDVRNLVDKGGNDLKEVGKKIEEGLKILATSEKIVVCCDYGMSRSNSIAAGIIAKKENIDFNLAVDLVVEKTGEKEIKIGMLDTVQQFLNGKNEVISKSGKILVTGSNGFVGKYFQKIVAEKKTGEEFIFLSSAEIDLTNDVVKLNMLCKREGVSTIVHLASPRIYTTSISFGQTIVMLKNVLDVCIQNQIKLIYTSTWEVFSGYKTSELLVDENRKMNPGGTYGQSKMLCENLINHYANELGLNSIILRLSPIYGLGADKPKCIWNFAEKAYANKEINTHLYLNGLPTLDLLHIEDAGDALLKATLSDVTGVFNISSGQSVTTKELAETIVGIFNSESKVTHTHLDLMTHNITLDHTKAEKILNWHPQKQLHEGLTQIANLIWKN